MKELGKEPIEGRNDYMRIKCNNSLITSFFLNPKIKKKYVKSL
jgi:hypothetical protein